MLTILLGVYAAIVTMAAIILATSFTEMYMRSLVAKEQIEKLNSIIETANHENDVLRQENIDLKIHLDNRG